MAKRFPTFRQPTQADIGYPIKDLAILAGGEIKLLDARILRVTASEITLVATSHYTNQWVKRFPLAQIWVVEANASLIAAAPDLLAAAEKVIERWEQDEPVIKQGERTMNAFGFEVQNATRVKRDAPPQRPIEFAPGCPTCGNGAEFVTRFTCPDCGEQVNPYDA